MSAYLLAVVCERPKTRARCNGPGPPPRRPVHRGVARPVAGRARRPSPDALPQHPGRQARSRLTGRQQAAGLRRRGAPGPEIPVVQMRAIDCVFGYQVNTQGLLQSVRGYWVAPSSASLPQSPALSPTAHPGLRRRTNERQPRAGTTTHRELNRRT